MLPHSKELQPLPARAKVRMQNLSGHHPKRWDRSGSVVEELPYDQYLVRTHGSGRVVRRNRRHLRQVTTVPDTPVSPMVPHTPPSTSPQSTDAHPTTPIHAHNSGVTPPNHPAPESATQDIPTAADVPTLAEAPAPAIRPLPAEHPTERTNASMPDKPPTEYPNSSRPRRATAGKMPSKYDDFIVTKK